MDNLSRGHKHNLGNLPFKKLNVADTTALVDLLSLEHVDAVVHFAAYLSVGESVVKPELYFSNNVGGSLSLLHATSLAGVKHLAFSSTAAVYGTRELTSLPEDIPFAPVSPYGETKVRVENVLRSHDRYSGLRSIALRYFNACGSDPESGLGEEHERETAPDPPAAEGRSHRGADHDLRRRLRYTGRHLASGITSMLRIGRSAFVRSRKAVAGRRVGCFQCRNWRRAFDAAGFASGGGSDRTFGALPDGTAARRRSGGSGMAVREEK